jgi:glycosyltransferase involved in cell wall biosynthesis
MEVVCCLVLGPNAYYHLAPLGGHPAVSRLWIVRPSIVERGQIPNAEYVLVAKKPTFWRLVQMLWINLRLGRLKEVKVFSSLNPFPYGLVQLPAALLFNKPIHFGFVGTDWYRHAKGRLGWLLRPLIRRADFVTVTGKQMRQQMITFGIEEQRIAILPHAIDIDNYPVNSPDKATYTCIFVGRLTDVKRVDLILKAFAMVLAKHPYARLCIVGTGALSQQLQDLAQELGIENSVDFVGFQANIQPYVSNSKIMVMASDREGLPFAMIEAMCSGLVPISTPVGTIEDLIVHGENGLLFPQEDYQALARSITSLLEDEDRYLGMRSEALKARETYSFAAATAVWDRWFESIDRASS